MAAVDNDPFNTTAMVGVARLAYERGDEEEALLWAQRTLEITPSTNAQIIVARLEGT